MRAFCLISGDQKAQLDHLATLASLLDIPLFLTDYELYEQSLIFYPFTTIHLIEESSILSLLTSADFVFVSCKHFSSELSAILKFFYKKSPRFCYCPHGNSDKGWLRGSKDLLQKQDLSLVYGSVMLKKLKKTAVLSSLNATCITGNYREIYYQKHKDFYDALAKEKIFSNLNPNYPTLMYAPTWNDEEHNSSFFSHGGSLLKNIPKAMNLLIKLHPSIERDNPVAADELINRVKERSQTFVIKNFTPIYPLLAHVDALLSDVSSIGYDFLYFNRPLFLIAPEHVKKKQLRSITLATCSTIINPNKDLILLNNLDKKLYESTEEFKGKRKKLYAATFDSSLSEHNFASHLLNFMHKQIYDFPKP